MQSRKKKESGTKKHPMNTVTGVITVTRRGVGYVAHEDFTEDIEIAEHDLNTALNGDTVKVIIHPSRPGKRINGAVTEVLERSKTRFVGIIEKENGSYQVVADDQRMYAAIVVSADEARDIPPRTKVVVELSRWDNPRKNPFGKIVNILGPHGEHETEMHAIIVEHGFDTAFPEEVEAEAVEIQENEAITSHDIADRRDMRGITTFTIDPVDAKDFDDALSLEEIDEHTVEVGIHIADVTHYVRPGSAIDREARRRGTSIYLVDRTIPMLPEALSNDVCSLNPNEDKLTFSAIFKLDKKTGEVKDQWFGETIIHSDKRFTYEEAQRILDAGAGLYYDELNTLNTIAKTLQEKRLKKGAIDFDQPEVKFELDEKGVPIRIFTKAMQDTNRLIEDFMLLANREVARYFQKLCKDKGLARAMFIYRVHDVPNPEKIEELGVFLRAIGYDFETGEGIISAKYINALFKEIEGTPEENMIKLATIRSMAKAVYSTKNIGHFGLSFQYYTHFTSPIRRYPDIMVHRIFKSRLLDNRTISKEELLAYERLTIASSQREIEAVEAERESIKYKQVEYMLKHVGEEFDARVSGVTEWGLFVEEIQTRAEGLIRLNALSNDYYVLEKERYRLVGKRTGTTYRLGDPLRIKLVGGSLETRQLDFALV